MWSAAQQEFVGALLDPERPVPRTLTCRAGRMPAKRFAVYRNNVVVSLVGALRARFPVVERIVGADCFAATARDFVLSHPPRSPLLMCYGDAFPGFIATFAPLAGLPYLSDVARLEAARTRAYHAADAMPVHSAALRGLGADQLYAARATLHPSAHVIRSQHPIVTIWAMNSGEIALRSIEEERPEDALVVRPHLAVTVRRLLPGGAALLEALAGGEELGRAAELARKNRPGFNLSANLAALVESGALAALGAPAVGQEIAR